MTLAVSTKKLAIIGSTGSIGTSALEVVKNTEGFEIEALACGKNIELLASQIQEFKPKFVCVEQEKDALFLEKEFPEITVFWGEKGIIDLIENADINIVLICVVGIRGLKPTICALNKKINVALANKETLVTAGDYVMKLARENEVKILPVDSEHSAILQCLNGSKHREINKLIITASGGPFLNKSTENVTIEETLNHPKWKMGKKITVDSATLMNKGLEVIEAHHLFNMPYEKIEVVIHPQSLLHSAVEFSDGSIIAQMGLASMHIPIQYALTYPERLEGVKSRSFDFVGKNLTFEKPNFEKFPCLKLAFEAGKKGGNAPCVLNCANEIAVGLFLKGEIGFKEIFKTVEKELENFEFIENPAIEEIFETDRLLREKYAEPLNC